MRSALSEVAEPPASTGSTDGGIRASRARERRSRLAFLDGLRGLAAFYVMVGHARWLLWEGYSDGYKLHPERYSTMGKIIVHLLSAFRWGHEAVIFFFVLSGFVIHLRYAAGLANGSRDRFDFWPYFVRRARRLYPPLLAALAVTFGLDLLGRTLRLPTAFGATSYPLINANVGSDHSLPTLLRNLVFIMDPVYGSDGPLWSLNYEWYFYLIYPAIFVFARRSWKLATAALIALSALGFAPLWPRSMFWLRIVFQLMIVWWFGALLADRFAGRIRIRYATLSWLLLAPLALAARHFGDFWHDVIVGLGFSGVIAACLAWQESGRSLSALVRLRPLGAMSYTLYVVHFPVLVFLSGSLMRARGGSLPDHLWWVAAGILLCSLLAWALHFVVERPFTTR
jgi:peptidoglycan/LPS O-acetylase OafA/YrhL